MIVVGHSLRLVNGIHSVSTVIRRNMAEYLYFAILGSTRCLSRSPLLVVCIIGTITISSKHSIMIIGTISSLYHVNNNRV